MEKDEVIQSFKINVLNYYHLRDIWSCSGPRFAIPTPASDRLRHMCISRPRKTRHCVESGMHMTQCHLRKIHNLENALHNLCHKW